MTKRLSKDDWIKAGFLALTQDGPKALKAEPLARSLNTTKGSFYWHFSDVPAFQSALMNAWETQAIGDVDTGLNTQSTTVSKLRRLGNRLTSNTSEAIGGAALDPAMRAWARENAAVAATVSKVDALRMRYVSDLLAKLDLTNPELTRILYASHIGMQDLTTRDGQNNNAAMGTLVDLILALDQ